MLQSLYVKNLALIEEAEVEFGEGLNILSGETGAGKSVLIGSIQIALGGRVPKDMIRHGQDAAYLELVFQIDDEERLEALRSAGVDIPQNELVISRKLTAGKSISRVNGEFWPAAKLKDIAALLLDLHGQHEHQSLLQKSNHLQILDAYCHDKSDPLRRRIQKAYLRYNQIQNELQKMQGQEADRKREASYLRFVVQEIEEAGLTEGEDEELAVRYKKLSNQKQLSSGMEELHELLGYDSSYAAGERVGQAVRVLQQISGYDAEGLEEIQNQLYDLESILTDLNQSISSYGNDLESGEEEWKEVEDRLDLIHDLKSKYGSTIEAILHYGEEQQKRLYELEHFEEHQNELMNDLKQIETQLKYDSRTLSEIRKKAAGEMENRIIKALSDLNFFQVRFRISFEQKEGYGENGTDQVEFLISTNPGEELKPLIQIASGGELSRIMLAIKTVLADVDRIPTLVFDEIDAGISGRTAQFVSEKLAYISRSHQVICISHLPQIVAMADTHFLIEKRSEEDSTCTGIFRLSEEDSVAEVARLLGGTRITSTTIDGAKEMKEQAKARKRELLY